jgi:hypothetical protein
MMFRRILGLALLLCLAACQDQPPGGQPPGVAPPPPAEEVGYVELEDDNLPLDGPGVSIDDELQIGLASPKPGPSVSEGPRRIFR